MAEPDVIDTLAGIAPGDALERIRANRPEARAKAQQSYRALFEPASEEAMSREERFAVAAFVSALHGVASATDFYAQRLVEASGGESVRDVLLAEAEGASGVAGPYGRFRLDLEPLSVEGPEYLIDGMGGVVILGDRIVGALEYAHFLVFHPRDADRARLQSLLDCGWDTTGIVTLSQMIAFLTFQIRVVAGLTAMRESLVDAEGVAA